jgi:DUF3047 family protein
VAVSVGGRRRVAPSRPYGMSPVSRTAGAARRTRLGVLAMLLLAAPVAAETPAAGEVGRFRAPAREDALPAGWEPLTFKKIARHTRYAVVREGDGWVLRAEADASASGLYRPLDLDAAVYRVLTWRWKVENVLAKADARTKEGDDYPARVYVAFRYDPDAATLWERTRYDAIRLLYGQYPPKGVLNYVWDNRLPPGTTLDNAYTDRAKMIVVRSGPALVGQWLTETRDIYADWRRLFGGEPPRIAGIAVMTDTDDTGERAVAYYDAITLRATP